MKPNTQESTMSLFDAKQTRADQIFEKFAEFHRANPRVWELFKAYTFDAVITGREHYSAKAIFERIRWHVDIELESGDLKLNNNFTAYYARMFHVEYPGHDGFFRNRFRTSEEKPINKGTINVSPPADEEDDLDDKINKLLEM